MNKRILRNGIFGGIIVATLVILSIVITTHTGSYEGNMLIGYAAMLLAFSFVFVAVKGVRDKELGGTISFGKALKTALLVTLVTSTIYVLAWLVCYYVFMPDYMDKYTAHMMGQAKAEGASAAGLAKQSAEMESWKRMYQNPVYVILFTHLEILPVGVVVSVIAALVLKRKYLQKEVYATGNA